ncbi:hypothetical protein [Jannaschia sp. M317]|uniref:hypothetical protein n=1 Tax=Jannaschia sp. M317 TaxID=2867011 RepID=UPI0021A555E8|nr:hypothetical protein [Jannaschia sp. M317]UWQ19229.1 hypothetical protein K3551_08165 [Jannaschia sp. M317]
METLGKSLADIVSILVALWFLFAEAFADIPAKPFLDAVALFVIGSALWRIWKRWGTS